MLKGIPSILSPHLLKILMEMGQGEELVLGDGNFPAETHGREVVRLDGHGTPEVLEAILTLCPLDHEAERPIALVQTAPEEPQPLIWKTYAALIRKYEPQAKIEFMERAHFYQRARNAYAIVSTGERAPYANLILTKGQVL